MTVINAPDSIIRIEHIPENMVKNVRCVYGIDNARVGLFGSVLRFSYMVLLNDYTQKLLAIKDMRYGEIKEITVSGGTGACGMAG